MKECGTTQRMDTLPWTRRHFVFRQTFSEVLADWFSGTASYLVLVQLTVLVLLLSLLSEGDDDKTYKDVHHEEGNDDDVDDEEDGDLHPVVVDGTRVLSVGVDGFVQQPGGRRDKRSVRGSFLNRVDEGGVLTRASPRRWTR